MSKSSRKRRRTRPISSHLDRTSLTSDDYIAQRAHIFRGTAGNPERAGEPVLSARLTNQKKDVAQFLVLACGAKPYNNENSQHDRSKRT